MITKLKLGWKIITYLATSKSLKGHGIHSPFIFEFIQQVVNNKSFPDKINKIEALRKSFRKRETKITFVNYGAGSKKLKQGQINLGRAHKYFSTSQKTCQLLYSLTRWKKPRTIIELGTSFGFSTMYFCVSAPNAEVYTVEANAPSLDIALSNFTELNINNYKPYHLRFDDFLDQFPLPFKHPLLFYLDGDHRKEQTIRYIHKILPYISPESCIIIADIFWSYEMYQAWQEIIAFEEVTYSVETLHLGILFFRKVYHKKHIKIRYL
ncbi:MAG: hypothetical protein GVY19_09720 [Bacteroidetes bacterium]|jgi:predicted O-methyltransferase YrrM|nr:hypothetical protein [Bacteroidota bacterium]